MKIDHTDPTALSRIIRNPAPGNMSGRCVGCGVVTENGHKVKLSENFSGWPNLYDGEVFCPHCNAFMTEQSFRKKCWVADPSGVEFVKKDGVLERILMPPDPPFFIYVTRGGQKQGWLSALKMLNWSRETFFVSCDWIDAPVWTNGKEVAEMHECIATLREKARASKSELKTGQFGVGTTRRAMDGGLLEMLRRAKSRVRRPAWEMMVHVEK